MGHLDNRELSIDVFNRATFAWGSFGGALKVATMGVRVFLSGHSIRLFMPYKLNIVDIIFICGIPSCKHWGARD